jgi:hypothetical protein
MSAYIIAIGSLQECYSTFQEVPQDCYRIVNGLLQYLHLCQSLLVLCVDRYRSGLQESSDLSDCNLHMQEDECKNEHESFLESMDSILRPAKTETKVCKPAHPPWCDREAARNYPLGTFGQRYKSVMSVPRVLQTWHEELRACHKSLTVIKSPILLGVNFAFNHVSIAGDMAGAT